MEACDVYVLKYVYGLEIEWFYNLGYHLGNIRALRSRASVQAQIRCILYVKY